MTIELLLVLRDTTILFAEDDEALRSKTKDSLAVLFKNVIEAVDGEDALEKYIDKKPDIMLTDIKMPKMNGIELVSNIRKLDMNIPIILFSGHGDQEYLLQAIKLQVQGYIVKPVDTNEMLEVFALCAQKLTINRPLVLELDNGVTYKPSTNQLFKNTHEFSLSAKERAVMCTLVKNHPNIVTKENLSQEVWPMEQVANTTMKSTIDRLRAKIGQRHIISVTGVGWRFEL